MPGTSSAEPLDAFTTCGDLLRYLRRRARLTQRDLSIAVGYSEAQISYLEKNRRRPDPAALAALFVPALGLEKEPALTSRLLQLAMSARDGDSAKDGPAPTTFQPAPCEPVHSLETIPQAAPFEIERPHALARLRARLQMERRVALYGLAGSGKTTLAAALAREYARSMPVFWFTFTEGVTTTVDALVRQLALFLQGHGQEQMALLLRDQTNPPPALPLDRQMALIGAGLNARPAFLCLHNIHLVQHDVVMMQLLQHLVATTPAFLLLTSREQVPLSGLVQLALDGLEREEGQALIQHLANGALGHDLAIRLLDKTGGSPMLLRLAIGQLLDLQAGVWQMTDAPQTAHAEAFIERLETQSQVSSYLLDAVLKQLSPMAWDLLALLSVLRQPADLSDGQLWEAIYGRDKVRDVEGAARELLSHHLIDNTWQMRLNPLVRDYIYRMLSADPKRYRYLQRAVGEWCEEVQGDGLEAAFHFARAGLLENASDALAACRESIIQGGKALAAVAVVDEVLTQARRRPSVEPDLLRRLLGTRGYLLSGTLRADESEADYREALALSTNPAVRADLVYELTFTLLQRNQHAEALRMAQMASDALSSTDLLLRARLAAVQGRAYVVLVNYHQAAEMANLALQLADQLIGVPLALVAEIRSNAYFALAEVARACRDLPAAFNHGQRALAAAQQAHLRRDENTYRRYIGGLLFDQGDLEGSFRFRREGLAGSQAIGDSFSAAYAMIHLADNFLVCLDLAEAFKHLDQAREIFWQIGDMRGLASEENLRATCLITQGQDSEARAVVERLLVETDGTGTIRSRGYYLAKLAIAQLLQGETKAAQASLQRALALPAARDQPMLRFQVQDRVALAFLSVGDVDAAEKTLAQAPEFDGLSIWSTLDRRALEGFIALARGDLSKAAAIAAQAGARAANYPYYHRRLARLNEAIHKMPALAELPALMWHLSVKS